MALFTPETDYPSKTGYPLENSRQHRPTSKHSVCVLLFSCKVSVLAHFPGPFNEYLLRRESERVSNMNFHHFGHTFPLWNSPSKNVKQNSNIYCHKTTFTAQQEPSPTNYRRPTRLSLARCHKNFVLIGYFVLPIVFSCI